ncbi:Golgi resident protein GCP60 [Eumeta japonica]|uniref:Golgi resident protein GCP60 n=1 Tax=Eumeta variegata TaxID=151549 RepID=A0A4C1WE65_EUMVA|nr:Golgi resident protein GCP60 [Eumeta japonica]
MANIFENKTINAEKVPLETDQGILESEEHKWGLPLKEVYKYGITFYKDKEGKALHLSYEDRLKLVAYTQQAAHGPFDPSSAPPLGVFDVIGRDRRAAWQALGQMSQIQAMAGFTHILDRLCPLFKPYLEAIQKDLEDKKQRELQRQEEEKSHVELQKRIELEKRKQQSNKLTEEQQIQRIKDALNAQTYDQFLQYAQQQYPGNYDQQAILIRQLQDQHYQQYIQQLAIDQRLANSKITQENEDICKNENLNETEIEDSEKDCNLNLVNSAETDNKSMQTTEKSQPNDYSPEESKEEESEGDCDGFPSVDDARMWTYTEIKKFKDSAGAGGGKLTVGHGETLTIRVPTHENARCIYWEFATDNYDIDLGIHRIAHGGKLHDRCRRPSLQGGGGLSRHLLLLMIALGLVLGFGLYFEWNKSPTTEVTIQLSESDEEDGDDENFEDEEYEHGSDPEMGSNKRESSVLNAKPPVTLIIPIYRRDCHTENTRQLTDFFISEILNLPNVADAKSRFRADFFNSLNPLVMVTKSLERYGSDSRVLPSFDQLMELLEKECWFLDNIPQDVLESRGNAERQVTRDQQVGGSDHRI